MVLILLAKLGANVTLSDESNLKQIEQQKAIEVRQQAMERIGETKECLSNDENDTNGTKRSRRSSSDTMDILCEKMLRDQELHELRKTKRMEELNLQKAQSEQNSKMVTLLALITPALIGVNFDLLVLLGPA